MYKEVERARQVPVWKQCIKKLKGLDKYQCDISDKQHAEIMQIVTTVNDSEAVRQLIAERSECFMPSRAAGCYRTTRIRTGSKQDRYYVCVCIHVHVM